MCSNGVVTLALEFPADEQIVPQPEDDSDPRTTKDDSSTPAKPSEPSTTAASSEPSADSKPKSPYGRERVLFGTTLIAVIVLFSLTGTIEVYRKTLGQPAATTRFRTCEDGVRSLYAGFSRKLSAVDLDGETIRPRRPTSDPAGVSDLRALDAALASLEPLCRTEGSEALDAFRSLERWRHRSEGNARLVEQQVTPDAERALRYQSPRSPRR